MSYPRLTRCIALAALALFGASLWIVLFPADRTSAAVPPRCEQLYEPGDVWVRWVEDGEGRRHPGVFVGDNESAGWFGGGPSAYVVHPEAHQAEVVSIFRITPRTGTD